MYNKNTDKTFCFWICVTVQWTERERRRCRSKRRSRSRKASSSSAKRAA